MLLKVGLPCFEKSIIIRIFYINQKITARDNECSNLKSLCIIIIQITMSSCNYPQVINIINRTVCLRGVLCSYDVYSLTRSVWFIKTKITVFFLEMIVIRTSF